MRRLICKLPQNYIAYLTVEPRLCSFTVELYKVETDVSELLCDRFKGVPIDEVIGLLESLFDECKADAWFKAVRT